MRKLLHDFGPPAGETKIWRYMDLSKFISILESKALYFSRIDKLGDPYESAIPKLNIEKFRKELVKQRERFVAHLTDATPESEKTLAIERFDRLLAGHEPEQFFRELQSSFYVNCWHMNDCESAAMWNSYLKSDEGIAIQTSVDNLTNSFKHEIEGGYIGVVKYVNYDTYKIESAMLRLQPIALSLHKRLSFKHEQELRAIIMRYSYTDYREDLDAKKNDCPGIPVSVDVNRLIEKVYVAPTAQEWFGDVIRCVCKRYGLSANVVKSSLNDTPF